MSEKSAGSSPNLAVDTTRLAYERTLMAWVRTAVSLIAFGFSVFTFMVLHPEAERGSHAVGPRGFALAMMGTGLVALALALATVEHRRGMSALRREFGGVPLSLTWFIAVLVAALGLYGFVIALLAP